MNRMGKFEIDPKNMIMTAEPWIIGATAQAEAMKYGLTCNIPGVGCSSSMLANVSGWGGPGPSTVFMGSASENLLCAEWVFPNGDIIISGSAGSGAGWFSDEGPGPGQRALFRGGHGAKGEMGVCTKISFKLSPWPGPFYLPTEGPIPAYRAKLPDNIKAYALCFPNWDKWAQAMMMLCDSEVVYIGHRQFSMFGRDLKAAMLEILNDPDKQLGDLMKLVKDPKVQKTNKSLKIEMYVIIAGMTPEDMEWKEAAIDKILEMYGGWKDERCLQPDIEEWLKTYFIRMGHKNLNYTMCGSYEGHFGLKGSNLIYSASICEEAFALKKEWEKKGTFMAAVGGDCSMGGLGIMGGGGGPMLWEYFLHFDAYDKDSISQSCNYINTVSQKFMSDKNLGPDFCKGNEILRKKDGYSYSQEEQNAMFRNLPQPAPFIFQWKIREAFNPNHLGGSYYSTLDPKALGK
jgi:glycolate oxidase